VKWGVSPKILDYMIGDILKISKARKGYLGLMCFQNHQRIFSGEEKNKEEILIIFR
jgi:hypothetical protein